MPYIAPRYCPCCGQDMVPLPQPDMETEDQIDLSLIELVLDYLSRYQVAEC
jgi:hypothetical protein